MGFISGYMDGMVVFVDKWIGQLIDLVMYWMGREMYQKYSIT
jgi:hypothetical protein